MHPKNTSVHSDMVFTDGSPSYVVVARVDAPSGYGAPRTEAQKVEVLKVTRGVRNPVETTMEDLLANCPVTLEDVEHLMRHRADVDDYLYEEALAGLI